ncbi:MAG: elongation factor P hydroxylase [Flavobacteriales bacterium]|jgi:elongation factor P hydroxylase
MLKNSKFNEEQMLEILHRCCVEQFMQACNTVLVGGADEPLYQPAQAIGEAHKIFYSHNYLASALHELAHWCVAGDKRLELLDYGYWYAPDGRSAEQQSEFERVEIKPQALEWILSQACGRRFRVSADNLTANAQASSEFKQNIYAQVLHYCEYGVPSRAKALILSLHEQTCRSNALCKSLYSMDDI